MSLIDTLRRPGTGRRQAKPSPRLAAENRRLQERLIRQETRHAEETDEYVREIHELTCHLTELGIKFKTAKEACDRIGKKASLVDEYEHRATVAEQQRDDDYAELVALRQFKANVLSVSTLPPHGDPDPDNQETEPVRHVGDEFPEDYLDQMRTGWKPKPAVLEVDLGEPTAENRFPATARISA